MKTNNCRELVTLQLQPKGNEMPRSRVGQNVKGSELLPLTSEVVAVNARLLGVILGLSERTIRRHNAAGKLPRPVRVGGSVRWRLDEIRAWLDAGCPTRAKWEEMHDAR